MWISRAEYRELVEQAAGAAHLQAVVRSQEEVNRLLKAEITARLEKLELDLEAPRYVHIANTDGGPLPDDVRAAIERLAPEGGTLAARLADDARALLDSGHKVQDVVSMTLRGGSR